MPGRCAAPPAPAMMTSRPRARAPAAYSNSRSGVRCADTTRTSCGIAELVERIGRRLHRLPVGGRAHDDADQRLSSRHCSRAMRAEARNSSRAARRRCRCAALLGAARRSTRRLPLRHGRSRVASARAPRERRRALGDEALAPALDALEALGFARVAPLRRGERGTDRLGIDLAHQLADVLALTRTAAVAGDGARRTDRVRAASRAGRAPRAPDRASAMSCSPSSCAAARRACARSCSGAPAPVDSEGSSSAARLNRLAVLLRLAAAA